MREERGGGERYSICEDQKRFNEKRRKRRFEESGRDWNVDE